jgi:hypothetical protein
MHTLIDIIVALFSALPRSGWPVSDDAADRARYETWFCVRE